MAAMRDLGFPREWKKCTGRLSLRDLHLTLYRRPQEGYERADDVPPKKTNEVA
jgi:hypothetical protein